MIPTPNRNGRALFTRLAKRLAWERYVARANFRLRVWDGLLSRRTRKAFDASCLMDRELPPVIGDDAILRDPRINPQSLFTPVFVKPSREYVYHVRHSVVMEPEHGFVIMPPRSLLFESVPLSEQIRSRKTMVYCSALPSFSQFLMARAGRLPMRRERAIAPMRFVFEPNYYHFIQDTLTRLALLDRHGVSEQVPLVISKQIANAPFFAQVSKRGALGRRRWLVQDGFYIQADEAFIVRTGEGNRDHLDHLMDLMAVPAADPARRRRIFLTRDIKKRGRGITNMAALAPVLAEFQIETVDTDQLSFDEQIALFNEAGLVVAVHGAGLTNIMFRRGAKLDLVEIFSPTETPLYFYILARTFGYGYTFVKGIEPDGVGTKANFAVDPQALRQVLLAKGLAQTTSNGYPPSV